METNAADLSYPGSMAVVGDVTSDNAPPDRKRVVDIASGESQA